MLVGKQAVIERTETQAGKVAASERMIPGRQAQRSAGLRINDVDSPRLVERRPMLYLAYR